MIEEYLTGFGPRHEPAVRYQLDGAVVPHGVRVRRADAVRAHGLGLYRRVPCGRISGLVHFHRPGSREFTHFIFPLLKPAIQPELAARYSQAVSNGRFVATCTNYWVKTTGVYYFPGMYTADPADDTRHLHDPKSDHAEQGGNAMNTTEMACSGASRFSSTVFSSRQVRRSSSAAAWSDDRVLGGAASSGCLHWGHGGARRRRPGGCRW